MSDATILVGDVLDKETLKLLPVRVVLERRRL